MKMKRNLLLKGVGLLSTAAILSGNIFSATAYAAAPVLTVNTTAENAATAVEEAAKAVSSNAVKAVSNLRIINLETPRYGKEFDKKALVMTDEGIFWEIPVIWIDEEGNIPLICLPGIKYTPVFVFYTPAGVAVSGSKTPGGYTIKLPEFLGDYFSSEELVMIGDPSRNITYITCASIMAVNPASGQKELPNCMMSFSALTGFGNSDRKAYDYASYVESHSEPVQSSTDNTENTVSEEPVAENQAEDAPAPYVPVVIRDELVRIHCSNPCVKQYGEERLKNLLDTIIKTIQPQAVYQLMTGFPAYEAAAGAEKKELGEQIGLYIYSHKYTNNKKEDIDACAFVANEYTNQAKAEFGYYIGVDVESIYTYDTDLDDYFIEKKDKETFENTIVHELMHAFMADYTRAGMVGVGNDSVDPVIKNEANQFPCWFYEGVASAVENVFAYRVSAFNKMKGSNEAGELNKKYDFDVFKAFYEDKNNKASIDSKNKFYDKKDNEISAYAVGYLAILYMSSLASDHLNTTDPQGGHEKTVVTYEEGSISYNNEGFKEGFNYILQQLHNGKGLNDVVKEISGGAYQDTEQFQNSFISGEGEEQNGKSLYFCVNYLNYLDAVTDYLVEKTGDEKARANGSMLLPFDTELKSPIQPETPPEMLPQILFNIVDKKDYVTSTVDDRIAAATGGLVGPGKSNLPAQESTPIQIAAKIAAKDQSLANEETPQNEAAVNEEIPQNEAAVNEETPQNEAAVNEETAQDEAVVNEEASQEEAPANEEALKTEGKEESAKGAEEGGAAESDNEAGTDAKAETDAALETEEEVSIKPETEAAADAAEEANETAEKQAEENINAQPEAKAEEGEATDFE